MELKGFVWFHLQRVSAELQDRVKGEFRFLHQILHDEETYTLEQLKREQDEELEKVQRHLEAIKLVVGELEENMGKLQQASASTENGVLTEVSSWERRQKKPNLTDNQS